MTRSFDQQQAPQTPYARPMVGYASPDMGYYYASVGRGRVVRALLFITIAFELAGVGVKLYELSLPPDTFASDGADIPVGFLLAMAVQALGYVALFIATAIVFCMWMYRAHANLGVLGRDDLEYTSGWAAGAWFVPFLNLVRPYQIMKEIYKASAPRGITTAAWRSAPDPAILGVWWGAWIIGNLASNISTRMDADPAAGGNAIDMHRATLYLDIAIAPVIIAAAWLAIVITRRIDDMQSERYVALSQYASEQQFPPDQYPPQQR